MTDNEKDFYKDVDTVANKIRVECNGYSELILLPALCSVMVGVIESSANYFNEEGDTESRENFLSSIEESLKEILEGAKEKLGGG